MPSALHPVGDFVNLLVVLLLGVSIRLFLTGESGEVVTLRLDLRPVEHHRRALFDEHLVDFPSRHVNRGSLTADDAGSATESNPPLPGTARTSVIPAARVTGICSLDGETAVAATTSGLKFPVSVESTVALTAPISRNPICVTESKIPG